MSTPASAYTFLSWARQGLGVHVQNAAPGAMRGSIPVSVTIRGTKLTGGDETRQIPKDIELYGPGDIIGIDSRAIVRTEPRAWITNFESNYLPFVEFYDEDFPWRYTPAAPSADERRLTPWLALVVLEEGEFTDAARNVDAPLASILVPDAADKFPPASELWAWAHVHLNDTPGGAGLNDTGALADRLGTVVDTDRDRACSRLLCPRALKPNTPYHAFLIPVFETGRQAGLGIAAPVAPSATTVAWADPAVQEFPVYYRWYFRTGSVGDFEYLVRLLKPMPADARVGRRDMDVQAPGGGLNGIDRPDLNNILRLGGALRVPVETLAEDDLDEYTRYDEWAKPFPQPFQQDLAALLNLPAKYADEGADEDPLIAPPIYGCWHAGVTRLLDGPIDPEADRVRWLNELNLDPRFRVAAGFGTSVVQRNQEAYMEAAWQQVGKVLAGNHRIRFAQMALAASSVWDAKLLQPLARTRTETYLLVSAPVQRRVVAGGLTVRHRMAGSTLPTATVSTPMRRALRPRSRIAKLGGFDAAIRPDNLLERINRGEVTVAPPKTTPPGLPTAEEIADAIRPTNLPQWLMDALRAHPWLRWLPLLALLVAVAILILFAPGFLSSPAVSVGLLVLAAGAWRVARWISQLLARDRAVDALLPENSSPAAIDALPSSPDFQIGEPGAGPLPTTGATDSPDAVRFKDGLRNLAALDVAERALPVETRSPLDLSAVASTLADALVPAKTIPKRTLAQVSIPARISDRMTDEFGEVMVYPVIDLPMYEPLKDLSPELFLPNIHLIAANSITLLETNQKFIEAYMVGLNHEFARELLWREYPCDQRGSTFRQFWDVRGYLPDPTKTTEEIREQLRDIPELHTWRLSETLEDHDQREINGEKEEEVVLVIRGELLKKYPTAVIYAHRAKWQRHDDGTIDKSLPRLLEDLTPAQERNPPRDLVKTPLYEARVDPDITFFGFDLSAAAARGGPDPGGGEDDPGWFFVIKERPGDPRFGLDVAKSAPQTAIHTWNDLSWTDVMPVFQEGAHLRVGARTVTLTEPPETEPPGVQAQHEEDSRFRWRGDTHAAELAYILYQVPVLMAVHAAEMLPQES